VAHRTAARHTAIGRWRQNRLIAFEVIWQRLAFKLPWRVIIYDVGCSDILGAIGCCRRGCYLSALQRQVQLIRIPGTSAEPVPIHPGKALLKVRDLDVAALQLRHQNVDQLSQFGGVIGDYESIGLHR
jgi:hypothetical protein